MLACTAIYLLLFVRFTSSRTVTIRTQNNAESNFTIFLQTRENSKFTIITLLYNYTAIAQLNASHANLFYSSFLKTLREKKQECQYCKLRVINLSDQCLQP